ncbi:MAG: hypothetical protein J0J15_21895 [Mesorhizobium sp.]|nr:hypothetical protein [Mesorhizobium sp.]
MARAKKTADQPESATITAYKGFRDDLTCRPKDGIVFQYEIGKTYRHDGPVKACKSGFHVITGHPLALFNHYAPAGTRICQVEISGATHSDDNGEKTAAEILTVGKEIGLTQLILDAVKWVTDRAKLVEGDHTDGDGEAVKSMKDRGAATASGTQGAATASGWRGAATASGWRGAATASGFEGKARGKEGCALFLVERSTNDEILHAWAGIVGRDGIKPDQFYRLVGGKPVEVD